MSILSEIIRIGASICKAYKGAEKIIHNPPRNMGDLKITEFASKFEIESWKVEGFQVLTVAGNPALKKHVIFFHGGAYVMEALAGHRKIIEEFAGKYGLTVSVIDYPLAPEHTAEFTQRVILKAYKEITDKNPSDHFYLFGDSAGGGLALAFLQVLRDQKVRPFPNKTALVSPWLDVTMSNREIKEVKKNDPLIPIDGLIYAGRIYAGKQNPKDSLISPIYGNVDNLGEIMLFVGTNEVFIPDCTLLKDKLSVAKGSSVDFHIGHKMIHDWVLTPIPEAAQTIEKIAGFYLS